MKFAKWTYLIAGIYGLPPFVPMLLSEQTMNRDYPPAITHPEYFYGFILVGIAFQVLFLIISRDPVRYRTMMIPTLLEKFPYALAMAVLFVQGRVSVMLLTFGAIDFVLGVLFLVAYLQTGRTTVNPTGS